MEDNVKFLCKRIKGLRKVKNVKKIRELIYKFYIWLLGRRFRKKGERKRRDKFIKEII